MSDFIDEPLILNIASRLPIESVLQCRCVCKRWRDLLHDLYFIQIHTDRQQQRQQQEEQILSFFILVQIPKTNACELHLQDYYVNYADEEEEEEVEEYAAVSVAAAAAAAADDDDDNVVSSSSSSSSSHKVSISRPLYPPVLVIGDIPGHKAAGKRMKNSLFHWFIIGSINGLICLYGNYGYQTSDYYNAPIICIYNPITKEHLTIPTDDDELRIKNDVSNMGTGFGYHPRTNEYKIVRIIRECPINDSSFYVKWVQVYTLGSGGGKWRISKSVDVQFYCLEKYVGDSLGIAFNGAIYWLFGIKVVSFHLEHEELRDFPSPRMSFCSHYELAVLAECLCVIEENKNIWILNSTTATKEYSEFRNMRVKRHIWSDDNRIWRNDTPMWRNVINPEHRAIASTSRGRVLFIYNQSSLVSFDPRTATRECLGDFPSFKGCWFQIMPYTKSWVSLKALGEEDAKIIERPIEKKKTNTTKRRKSSRSGNIDMNKQMIKLFTSLLPYLFVD